MSSRQHTSVHAATLSKHRVSSGSGARQSYANGESSTARRRSSKDNKLALSSAHPDALMAKKQLTRSSQVNQSGLRYPQSVHIGVASKGGKAADLNQTTNYRHNFDTSPQPQARQHGPSKSLKLDSHQRVKGTSARSSDYSAAQVPTHSHTNSHAQGPNPSQLHFAKNHYLQHGRNNAPSEPNGAKQLQKSHHQRSKFQGSFLAGHNQKVKGDSTQMTAVPVSGGNFAVSPSNNIQSSQRHQPMIAKQSAKTNTTQAHQLGQNMKITNKSPVAVSNPSTFSITTTQNNLLFNSGSPHDLAPGSKGSGQSRLVPQPHGSNPTSVKHNSTKTVGSDILNATDQSSTIKQRDNIKVFAFKPGNLKVQPKQLNVTSLKTSQISLNKEQLTINPKAKTRAPTQAKPSPTGLQSDKIIHQITKARNRSTGSNGEGTQNMARQVQARIANLSQSPEGTLSLESKRHSIVIQPNIVKKPITQHNVRQNSTELLNYHAQEQEDISADPTPIRSNRTRTSGQGHQISVSKSRIKSATRHDTQESIQMTSARPHSKIKAPNETINSTVKKLKVKKRGNSETMHTESSQVGGSALPSQTDINMLQFNSQKLQVPDSSEHKTHKVAKSGGNFQQRGNSLQASQVQIDQVSQKLMAFKEQQQQQTSASQQRKQNHSPAVDHKEVIVNHIRKYIKLRPPPEQAIREQPQQSEEMIIQNLRDFLVYLEQKNIINPQKLNDQNEMKSLIKDIMKLDLTKFSKPRASSQGNQSRATQNGSVPQRADENDQQLSRKPRKALPSPAAHPHSDAKTAPTQLSSATNTSQQSMANLVRVQQMVGSSRGLISSNKQQSEHLSSATISKIKQRIGTRESSDTSRSPNPHGSLASKHTVQASSVKYEYASQPKYLNYGVLNQHTRGSRGGPGGHSRSPPQQVITDSSETKGNLSGANFVLPSNRQQSTRSGNEGTVQGDIYGVKSQQVSLLQSSQNSPGERPASRRLTHELYKREQQYAVQNDSTSSGSHGNKTLLSSHGLGPSSQTSNIQIESRETQILTNITKKKRLSVNQNHQDQIAVEQQLQKLKVSTKPRFQASRTGSRTAAPTSTQQSPRDLRHLLGQNQGAPNVAHQKVSSQPNLVQQETPVQQVANHHSQGSAQQQQQVPTIQLMINTNGQGKFLGINVNNYCFAPQAPEASPCTQGQKTHQMHQLLQLQNNSAELLGRGAQPGVQGHNIAKHHQNVVKTEPDQVLCSQQLGANRVAADPRKLAQTGKRQKSSGSGGALHELVSQQHKAHSRMVPMSNGSSEFVIDEAEGEPTGGPGALRALASAGRGKRVPVSAKRKHIQQVMIIQDEEDDNTGGNGAEAKMSPSNITAQASGGMMNASKIHHSNANQSNNVSSHFGHNETPLVAKIQHSQNQYSSSNRNESGTSSQRNSFLTKALDLNKSQIQAIFGPKKSNSGIKQTPKDLRSAKSSSQERQLPQSREQVRPREEGQRHPSNVKARTEAPTAQNSPTRGVPQPPRQQVVLNDSVTEDREKLVRYIKAYVHKHNKIPHTTLDFYRFVKLLGKGAFGKITLGIHKLTGKYVAIKSIDKVNIKDEYSRRKVFQEVYILKKIRHSCVTRLLEVFESEKHFLMVMEYSGGGDLLQYVKKRKRLNEQSAKAIFKQILYALGHCHCRSVLHRDIKLDNVLMDGEGGVKLCDFGVSRLVKKGNTINEQCGTPAYLAPEIILDKGYQGFGADVWSLGVLLYAMVQGTVPFKAHNIADLHKLILKGEFTFPVESVSEEVKDLVRQMLVLDPVDRISIPRMLNHPWVYDMQREMGEPGYEDEEHDLKVGSTFFREEVLGGLITGYKCDGNENGNINFVNVENLYYRGGPPEKDPQTQPEEKVTYSDYCALTEDFMTYRIDEEAMQLVTSFGYPRQLVIDSINRGDVNHATAAYYLLVY